MSRFVVPSGKVALSAGATKTLVLLNPVTNNAAIYAIYTGLDGSAAAAGVECQLYRATTLGSPAGTSTTPTNVDDTDAVTATTTALTALTTEPTTATPIFSWPLQPLGGLLPDQWPLGREFRLKGAGTRWGVRLITPSGVSPDAWVDLVFDEG